MPACVEVVATFDRLSNDWKRLVLTNTTVAFFERAHHQKAPKWKRSAIRGIIVFSVKVMLLFMVISEELLFSTADAK